MGEALRIPESVTIATLEGRDAERAAMIFNHLDLTPADLKQHRTVVDIGAGRRLFEQRAREHGITNVISVEESAEELSKNSVLEPISPQRADRLPLADGSAGLIISHDGPHKLPTLDETEIINLMREIDRVLEPGGEARLWPPQFAFIRQQLLDDSEYRNYKILDERFRMRQPLTDSEREALLQFNVWVFRATETYLREHNFDAKLEVSAQTPEAPFREAPYYLKLSKMKPARPLR